MKSLAIAAAMATAFWMGTRVPEKRAIHPPIRPVVNKVTTPTPTPTALDLDAVFAAIRFVETGDLSDDQAQWAVGDGGRSRGAYQVGLAWYQDAVEFSPDLAGVTYEDAWRFPRLTEQLMRSYWRRYATKGQPWRAEELCRLHNGGPSKRGTDGYWLKCHEYLEQHAK